MGRLSIRKKNILYLCMVNGGRSIMAEAITNHFSGGAFRAYSAGLNPIKAIPPGIVRVLKEHNIPTESLAPKGLTDLQGPGAPKFDFVISTCDRGAGEQCPPWVGQPVRAHWDIPMPKPGLDPESFYREASLMYDRIYRCVNAFLNLPLDVMDSFALTSRIDAIGRENFSQRPYLPRAVPA